MSWTSVLPNWMQVPPPDGRSESQIEGDLDDELRFHVEQIERELREAGQDAEAARGLARLRFGDVESIKRRCRRIAMKERTMLQRVNFVMMAVVMLLVIGVAVQVMTTQRYNTLALQAITTEITNMKYNAVAAERESGTRVRNGDERLAGDDRGSVYVDGIVERQGQYELPRTGTLTVRRLLAMAGGLKGRGDVRVLVTQTKADGSTSVKLKDEHFERNSEYDFPLMPNDHVHVEHAEDKPLFATDEVREFHGLPDTSGTWRQVDATGHVVENGTTIEYLESRDVRNLGGIPSGTLRLTGSDRVLTLWFLPPHQSENLAIGTTSAAKDALSRGRWVCDNGTLTINIAPALPEIAEPLRFVQEGAGAENVAGGQAPALRDDDLLRDRMKISPFELVAWGGDGWTPFVLFGGKWYELDSINDVAASDIVAHCRRVHQGRERKRFSEDLVQVMTEMGHGLGSTAKIAVVDPITNAAMAVDAIPLTNKNRDRIRDMNNRSEGPQRTGYPKYDAATNTGPDTPLDEDRTSRAMPGLSREQAMRDLNQLQAAMLDQFSYL